LATLEKVRTKENGVLEKLKQTFAKYKEDAEREAEKPKKERKKVQAREKRREQEVEKTHETMAKEREENSRVVDSLAQCVKYMERARKIDRKATT
jgi:hypothetical protein